MYVSIFLVCINDLHGEVCRVFIEFNFVLNIIVLIILLLNDNFLF